MKTMVLAYNADQMRALCAIARTCGSSVEAIAIGDELRDAAVADKVWYLADQNVMFEDYTDSIAALIEAEKPELVLIEQCIRLRVVAGRLGAILGTSAMDSVQEFTADATVKHIVYGGAAVREERVTTPIALLLLDAAQYDAGEPSGACEVAEFAFVAPATSIIRTAVEDLPVSDTNLAAADRVVGIGRGIGAEEDLAMVREFAAAVKAEVGCTRPVAEEEKWLPREAYIGVSGITLSPSVYFAIGLSGQVQHMIGVNRADKIVAVNKDKNAMIFSKCDLGIVGDLYKVLPAVTAAFK